MYKIRSAMIYNRIKSFIRKNEKPWENRKESNEKYKILLTSVSCLAGDRLVLGAVKRKEEKLTFIDILKI